MIKYTKILALVLVAATMLLSSCSRRSRNLYGGAYTECQSDNGLWAFEVETVQVGTKYDINIYPIMDANSEGDYATVYIADSQSGRSQKVRDEVSLYNNDVITISGLTYNDISTYDAVGIVTWNGSQTLLEGGDDYSTFCELPFPGTGN